jgi:hypothetical protein
VNILLWICNVKNMQMQICIRCIKKVTCSNLCRLQVKA